MSEDDESDDLQLDLDEDEDFVPPSRQEIQSQVTENRKNQTVPSMQQVRNPANTKSQNQNFAGPKDGGPTSAVSSQQALSRARFSNNQTSNANFVGPSQIQSRSRFSNQQGLATRPPPISSDQHTESRRSASGAISTARLQPRGSGTRPASFQSGVRPIVRKRTRKSRIPGPAGELEVSQQQNDVQGDSEGNRSNNSKSQSSQPIAEIRRNLDPAFGDESSQSQGLNASSGSGGSSFSSQESTKTFTVPATDMPFHHGPWVG